MIAMLAPVVIAAMAGQAAVPIAQTGFFTARQPEVAAALELMPDGRFRYSLDYGAVSEIAGGRWTGDGRTVRLTSDPMPRAPSFAILADEPAPAGEYQVTLENPGFDWGGPLEFLATIDGSPSPVRIKPDSVGRVDPPPGRITAIRPIVPVYGDIGPPLALAGPGGHKLTVRFLRNDLGMARFDSTPLVVEDGGLRLMRYGASIRLVRSAPSQ